jgi:lyso-ornithine lipid O-acyltransferase
MVSPSLAGIDDAAPRRGVRSIGGWLRIGLRLAALVTVLLALLPLHYLTHALGRKSHWPSRFLGAAAWIVGADVRTVGQPDQHELLFVANHISAIDILALGGATATAFIGKAELKATPVVGWLASINRTLYVSRENRLGVGDQIAQLRDALSEWHRITVFPEGTTGDGRGLLPFKSSLLAVLEPPPPGLLVQPLWLDYGDATDDIAWVGTEGGVDYALRILARPERFTLTIHFLNAFDPQAMGGRKAVAAEAQRQIAAAMGAAMGAAMAV